MKPFSVKQTSHQPQEVALSASISSQKTWREKRCHSLWTQGGSMQSYSLSPILAHTCSADDVLTPCLQILHDERLTQKMYYHLIKSSISLNIKYGWAAQVLNTGSESLETKIIIIIIKACLFPISIDTQRHYHISASCFEWLISNFQLT